MNGQVDIMIAADGLGFDVDLDEAGLGAETRGPAKAEPDIEARPGEQDDIGKTRRRLRIGPGEAADIILGHEATPESVMIRGRCAPASIVAASRMAAGSAHGKLAGRGRGGDAAGTRLARKSPGMIRTVGPGCPSVAKRQAASK